MNGALPMPRPLNTPMVASSGSPPAPALPSAVAAKSAPQQPPAMVVEAQLQGFPARKPELPAASAQLAHQRQITNAPQPAAATAQPEEPVAFLPHLDSIVAILLEDGGEKLRRQVALTQKQHEALRRAQALQAELLSAAAVRTRPATADVHLNGPPAAGPGALASTASDTAGKVDPARLVPAPSGTVAATAEAARAAAVAGAAVAPAPAPKAQLSAAAEQQLLAFFSLQDSLTKDEARMLANRCGCTEDAVRAHFTKLRNTVRSFIQRAHRRAGGRTAPTAAHATGQSRQGLGPDLPAAAAAAGVDDATMQGVAAAAGLTGGWVSTPAAAAPGGGDDTSAQGLGVLEAEEAGRKRGLAKLEALLDSGGGIADPDKAGPFAALMQVEGSVAVRSALLQAVLATASNATLARLVAAGTCATLLAAWLTEAEADRQKTFLRLALNAAARLPWTLPLMRSGTFLQVVNRLQKNQVLNVSTEAGRVLHVWGCLESPYQETSAPASAVPKPQYQPPRSLAFSGDPAPAQVPAAAPQPAAPPRAPAAAQAAAQAAAGRAQVSTPCLVVGDPAISVATASGPAASSAYPVPVASAAQQLQQQQQQQLQHSQWLQQQQWLPQQQQAPSQWVQPQSPQQSPQPQAPQLTASHKQIRHAGTKAVAVGSGFVRGYQAIKQARAQKQPDLEQVRQKERARLASTALPPSSGRVKAQKIGTTQGHPQQQQQPKGAKRQAGTGSDLLLAASKRTAGQSAARANQPQTMTQVQFQAVSDHRRHRIWLTHQVSQLAEKAKNDAEAVKTRLDVMRAAPGLRWPPPVAEVPPTELQPGCGEESAEVAVQQGRCARQAAATYVLEDLIPDSPSESWEAAPPQQPDHLLPWVPFVPQDPIEMQDQVKKMVQAGVRLPTYVGTLQNR